MSAPEPFSGRRYHENALTCEDDAPCALCGKPVQHPWPHTVRVIEGGGAWAAVDAPDDGPGEMGCWPVGADCARRLRAAGVPLAAGDVSGWKS